MKLRPDTKPHTETEQTFRCFYRPHKRVQWRNECIDYKTGEVISPPSRTEQSHKDACDINNIVKRMKPHEMAQLIERNAQAGMYVDLPDNTDYQSAITTVMQAEASFNSLPSKVRERFNHDPSLFLTFATNSANIDELRALGLAAPSLPAAVPPAPPAAQSTTSQTLSPNPAPSTNSTPSLPETKT